MASNETGGRGVEKASDLASFSSLGEELNEAPGTMLDAQDALSRNDSRASEMALSPSTTTPSPDNGTSINGTNIRVLLAEDHVLVRAGIRALLESLDGVDVVGEASNGAAALELIENGNSPDVAILDVSMKGMSGLELAARIRQNHSDVRVIILSMHAGEEYVRQARQNGASGYLLKDSGSDELEVALRAVMRGEIYLSSSLIEADSSEQIKRDADDSSVVLTPRQREILVLIAQGLPTGQIAQRLSISAKTVETHRTQLMSRLNIFHVAGLTRYAIRNGLMPIDF